MSAVALEIKWEFNLSLMGQSGSENRSKEEKRDMNMDDGSSVEQGKPCGCGGGVAGVFLFILRGQ